MNNKLWWKDTAERVGSTACATLLPTVLLAYASAQAGKGSIDFSEMHLDRVCVIVALASAATLLKCMLARLRGDSQSASLSKDIGIVDISAQPAEQGRG